MIEQGSVQDPLAESIIRNEDSNPVTINLKTSQTLGDKLAELTNAYAVVTNIPDNIGSIYIRANLTSEVVDGQILSIDELEDLIFAPGQDLNGDSEFSFTLIGQRDSSASQESSSFTANISTELGLLEISSGADLNRDGILGVSINGFIYDPYSNTSDQNVSNDSRYLYDTSLGYLLSREDFSYEMDGVSGFDVRNVQNNSDSWNGPSFALLTNTDGSKFDLSNGLTVQKVIALRDGSDSSGDGMDDDVSGFKLFATDTNDNVTAYCFDLNGVLSSTENLSNAQVAALETQQIIDINNDGTVGVTVLDELVSRYSDASGGMANSSEENRYLYNTSNGLLISRDSLSAQNETDGSGSFMGDSSGNTFDLRYQYNENDSWNGPSFALLTNTDGSKFDLSNGLTVQKVIALRDGSDSSGSDSSGYGMDDDVSGFKLFATDTNDNVTAYCFDLNGVLSSTENLSNAQVAALETQQIIDINNDGTVGVTVLDELVSRYSDASGGMANSSEDNRYLYNTSNGLLISRDSLSAQNETDGSGSFMGDSSGNTFDLRYQYNENDSWNGPSFALLTNTDGSQFDLSNGLTVQKVIALRDGSDSSGGDSSGYGMDDDVSGFKLFATDTNDNVTAYCFDLNGVLSSTENLSDSQVAALETQQIIDINNDGTVGVTVLDELVSRYSDASGGMANSSEDNRYLYNTSNGLLISRDSLSAQNESNTPPAGDGGSGSLSFDNASYDSAMQTLRIQFFGDIDTANSNENGILNNLTIYTDNGFTSPVPNAITSVMIMGNELEINLAPATLDSYGASAGTDFYVKYDDTNSPGALRGFDGSEFSYFDSNFWYQQDNYTGDNSGYTPPAGDGGSGGLSFDNASYDSAMQTLRIQFFGDIDTANSNENGILNNLTIYTDGGFTSPVPNAITSVMIMGNELEINLAPATLDSYGAPAGTDFYVKYDDTNSPGALRGFDGSEFSYFDSNFWYQQDNYTGDNSGYTPPAGDGGSGSLSFDNASYDSAMQTLRIQFFGDIDTANSNENGILNNLTIYTDGGFTSPVPNAITSVMIMGNELEINLAPATLDSHGASAGTDFYVKYDDTNSPGALRGFDGSEFSYFDSNFWYQQDNYTVTTLDIHHPLVTVDLEASHSITLPTTPRSPDSVLWRYRHGEFK